MCKAIIFDFNGVLWWDSELQEKSWVEMSRRLRGKPFTKKEMIEIVHGRQNKEIIEYLVGKELGKKKLGELIQEKEAFYRDLCLVEGEKFRLSPGAIELLDFLSEKDIPFTIATSSGKANLDFFIKHLNLEHWFEISEIVYDDGKLKGKPHPEIYVMAARNLEVIPEECVIVEDSVSGIIAASRAGIGLIFGLGPVEKHGLLLSIPGINEVITSLATIPKKLFI